ncbi:MAG TPA: isochorismatase family cysteine hydrolase [Thermoanaerobaculia bacterium]|nr:isochorismatase family cysteine hydrolase [Thermoanaerobaculia bacterium]
MGRPVLLLTDFVNTLDWEGGERFLPQAVAAAERAAELRRAAAAADVPAIYVNDNYGRWDEDFRSLVERVRRETPGAAVLEHLEPRGDDYYVLKPMHSGFYATPLQVLLERLEAETLVLAGLQTHLCVNFTAYDAYMRGYRLLVPEDGSAAEEEHDHHLALDQMRRFLKADTRPVDELDFADLPRAGTART